MKKNKKQKIKYNKRVWLNPKKSHSTGAIVACAGDLNYGGRIYENDMFLELSSCNDVARIHRAGEETVEDFIKKLELVQKTVKAFKKHLKNSKKAYK